MFDDWFEILFRVEDNINRLLDIFVENNVKLIFFIFGWVGKCCLNLIKWIVDEGYELVSYGLNYRCVMIMDCWVFIEDV